MSIPTTDTLDDSLTRARCARAAQRRLGTAPAASRDAILRRLASRLTEGREDLIAANRRDLEAATELAPALRGRLELSPAKLTTLVEGVEQLAAGPDPLGRVRRHTELDEGLVLRQVASPIGVIL